MAGLHFRSLAQAVAHHAVLVAYDDDGRETERAAALRNLRYTLNADETVLEFEVARAYFLYVGICHDRLEFKSAFACCFGQLFNSSVIKVTVAVESDGRNAFGRSALGGQLAHQGGHFALGLAGGGFGHLLVQRGGRRERSHLRGHQ